MTKPDLRVISLGAGVQSTALYVMSAEGHLPKADFAVFADTCAEPKPVYTHLEFLRSAFGRVIPIHIVREKGGLTESIDRACEGERFVSIPLFTKSDNGKKGMMMRQCTNEFKINPIKRFIRGELGLKKGQRAAGKFTVEQWIGISLDEAHRAKPSNDKWITNRWPLLFDKPMTREQCKKYLRATIGLEPPRSACVYCPFHDDRTWAYMKANDPGSFAEACRVDDNLRSAKIGALRGALYLHESLKPLRDVEFGADTSDQLQIGFGNECEGIRLNPRS